MSRDKYREQFATAVAAAFRVVYPEAFREVGDSEVFNREVVYRSLEKPRDPKMAPFALPVFRYVRLLRDRPSDISAKIAGEANRVLDSSSDLSLVRVSAANGYLNAVIDFMNMARDTISRILADGARYGDSETGRDKTILVEYSSPNIAKPFGVGHLRTTIIGSSLRRIFKKLGYNVVGINYPGDWGTQFGKMIVAFSHWGSERTLEGEAVKNLLQLYIRYHEEAEKRPSLDDEARRAFKRLEDGDPDAVRLWEKFKAISHAEFDRIYSQLGVDFDLVIGESFFNDKMDVVVQRLEADGLTSLSEGALIVELDDPNLPPALLRKADGATLYITRDLAGMIYRWEKYRFHESLYVVGAAQADHFRQCLGVIEKMETAENLPPEKRMTGKVKHIEFGWVRFGQKTMSTRRGNIVFLEEVIDKAVALAGEIIREKNPDLQAVDKTARMIGVGAVVFSQLSVRRQKDVSFVWEEVLNFEGETGPYLQYTHARLCSLLRNYAQKAVSDVDCSLLDCEEERRVIGLLSDFPNVIAGAAENYEPYLVVTFLLRLASSFNKVYQRKDAAGRIDKIVSEDGELSAARMALVRSVQIVIKEGLYLLGIEAPEEM